MLAPLVCGGWPQQLIHGNGARAARALDDGLRLERDEHGREIGGMHGDAGALLEDGVILVLAVAGVALNAALEPALDIAAEVPAAIALQQVAADRRHGPQLRSGGV